MLPVVVPVQHSVARRAPVPSAPARRDGADERVRVKVHKFGEHLSGNNGALVMVPVRNGQTMDMLRGMLVWALHGDVDFAGLDYSSIRILLMPDGDEITMPEMLVTNDRLVVAICDVPFTGDLSDRDAIDDYMHHPTFGKLTYFSGKPSLQLHHDRLTGNNHHATPAAGSFKAGSHQQLGSDTAAGSRRGMSLEDGTATGAPAAEGSLIATASAGAIADGRAATASDPSNTHGRSGFEDAGDHDLRADVAEDDDGYAPASRVSTSMAPGPTAADFLANMGRSRRVYTSSGVIKMRRVVRKLMLIHRLNQQNQAALEATGGRTLTAANSRSSLSSGKKKLGKSLDAYVREQSNLYNYAELRKSADDEKLPWYLIRSDSRFRLAWDFITLVFVLYSAFVSPVKIGFEPDTPKWEQAYEYVSDCVFIIDLVLNFFTANKVRGVYDTTLQATSNAYFRGWFGVDLLATFPVHWITDALDAGGTDVSSVNRILRLLRLFKLFRILRLMKLAPKLFAVLETSVNIDPALLKFFRAMLALMLMWHLMGCAYWFIVRLEYNGTYVCPTGPGRPGVTCFVNHCLCYADITRDIANITVLPDSEPEFAYDPDLPNTWLPHPAYANMDLSTQFSYAVFWSIQVTTSIGGAGVSPFTSLEAVFTVSCILFGLVMYSVVIGAASSALSNVDAAHAVHRRMRDSVLSYMRARKVPHFFHKIIIDWFAHRQLSIADGTEDAVLEHLPDTLRAKLSLVINKDLVDSFSVFQFLSADVYARIVQRLARATYLPGEFIIRQGEVGDDLFLITTGKVDCMLPDGVTIFRTMRPGDIMGEHEMLMMTRRDFYARAVDFVDCIILRRADFTELYISSPDFIREVQRIDMLRRQHRLDFELQLSKTASHMMQDAGYDDTPADPSSESPSTPGFSSGGGAAGSGPPGFGTNVTVAARGNRPQSARTARGPGGALTARREQHSPLQTPLPTPMANSRKDAAAAEGALVPQTGRPAKKRDLVTIDSRRSIIVPPPKSALRSPGASEDDTSAGESLASSPPTEATGFGRFISGLRNRFAPQPAGDGTALATGLSARIPPWGAAWLPRLMSRKPAEMDGSDRELDQALDLDSYLAGKKEKAKAKAKDAAGDDAKEGGSLESIHEQDLRTVIPMQPHTPRTHISESQVQISTRMAKKMNLTLQTRSPDPPAVADAADPLALASSSDKVPATRPPPTTAAAARGSPASRASRMSRASAFPAAAAASTTVTPAAHAQVSLPFDLRRTSLVRRMSTAQVLVRPTPHAADAATTAVQSVSTPPPARPESHKASGAAANTAAPVAPSRPPTFVTTEEAASPAPLVASATPASGGGRADPHPLAPLRISVEEDGASDAGGSSILHGNSLSIGSAAKKAGRHRLAPLPPDSLPSRGSLPAASMINTQKI